MNDLSEAARDAVIRVTKAVHLGTAAPDGVDDMDYDLKEWLLDDVSYGLKWGVEGDDEYEQDEALHEHICDAVGWDTWVVEVQTPVPSRFSPGGFAFSWGHCWVTYTAGKTYEEAVRAAIKWAEEAREAERERQALAAS